MLERFTAFVRLSRLKFLAGGFAGGLLGTLVAGFERGRVDWRSYALAQGTITAFHLMTHYGNEYFDRDCDGGAARTPFSGGSGMLGPGRFAPAVALYAALACAAFGAAGTLGLWALVRQPAAAFIALGIGAVAWSYSAPPLRLCARGLGETATALVVGTLVPLCAYAAQSGRPDLLAVLSTLPGAAAMFAMMLAVEYPDLAADRAAGKRNLVVRLRSGDSRLLALAALAATYCAVAAAVVGGAPLAYALLEALTLPLAAGYAQALRHRAGGDPAGDAALAGRGVALFFTVTLYGALGFGAVLPPSTDGAAAETNYRPGAVVGAVIETAALENRLEAALDEVRPAILRDGGDVWLVKIDGCVAYVQMVGACGGCAMSTATLKGAIESAVRRRCPEIERVEQV